MASEQSGVGVGSPVVRREDQPFADRSDAAIFTDGTVESRPLPVLGSAVDRMRGQLVQASVVRFAPGARTVPHTHTGDQILVVLEGEGAIGEEGSPVSVSAGDVVVVSAGSVHVHAASERGLTHLSLLFGSTDLTLEGTP